MNIPHFPIATIAAFAAVHIAPDVSASPSATFVTPTPLLGSDTSGAVPGDPTLVVASTRFADLQGHWATTFIEALQARGIFRGFADGTFRPDAPMTRGELASVLQQAFPNLNLSFAQTLGTSPSSNSHEPISRLEVLVTLVKCLDLGTWGATPPDLDAYFQDASDIPDNFKDSVAAAIAHQILVTIANDPFLTPNLKATRADVAAWIYRALAIPRESSPVVLVSPSSDNVQPRRSLRGTDPTVKSDRVPLNTFTTGSQAGRTITPELPFITSNSFGGASRLPQDDPAAERQDSTFHDDRFPKEMPTGKAYSAILDTWQASIQSTHREGLKLPSPVAANSRLAHPSAALDSSASEDNAESIGPTVIAHIDTLRDRIRSLRIGEPELPPLDPAGTYLPETQAPFLGYIWPARGILTSGYGWRWGRLHQGIDIAAAIGTPVVAAAVGAVTYAEWDEGGYGNLVEIQHPDGSFTRYAHLDRMLVHEGQQVEQGQLIGEMGSTGNSTGPHLHFELHLGGHEAVDPVAYLTGGGQYSSNNWTMGQARHRVRE